MSDDQTTKPLIEGWFQDIANGVPLEVVRHHVAERARHLNYISPSPERVVALDECAAFLRELGLMGR